MNTSTKEIGSSTTKHSINGTGAADFYSNNASDDWSAHIALLVCNSVLGCVLACAYKEYSATARIVKANRLVRAQIVEHKAGRHGGAHDSDVPASMLLSYDYENENHQVWKNNYAFESSSSSRSCNVYVDPSNPDTCLVQGQRWAESRLGMIIGIVVFFVLNAALYLVLTNLMLVTKASKIIAWVLYGSVYFMPTIAIMCSKCCRSLTRQGFYSGLDAKGTAGDIEM
mmetsp:Transcript_8667/g.12535  ORF Transcript_8667/g.12535 Transcript_8667/m.12535 type:complete len:227 (+) Transcript_8667:135-815(+)